MTWVAVVKFWAYQAHQLRIIVYAKTMRTIHGLELFSSANRQWVSALASDKNIGHDFNLPLSCSVYAYSICHQGSAPGATGIQDGKAYDVGWNNTPVWIIAIGNM